MRGTGEAMSDMDWEEFQTFAAERAERWRDALQTGRGFVTYEHHVRSRDTHAEREAIADAIPSGRWAGLYIFDVAPECATTAATAFAQFREREAERPRYERRMLPRIEPGHAGSACLYVGKCRGENNSVRGRLKEHVDVGARETSALRLVHWLPDECWPVRLRVVRFTELDDGLLEFMEDRLWERERPLLGRKAGN